MYGWHDPLLHVESFLTSIGALILDSLLFVIILVRLIIILVRSDVCLNCCNEEDYHRQRSSAVLL